MEAIKCRRRCTFSVSLITTNDDDDEDGEISETKAVALATQRNRKKLSWHNMK